MVLLWYPFCIQRQDQPMKRNRNHGLLAAVQSMLQKKTIS